MKFAAVLALLVAAGCTEWAGEYEGDPTENAIATYEELHRPLTEKCRDQALNVDIDVAPIDQVQHACNCGTDCGGCMDRYDAERGGHVWVMENAPPRMLAHETEHVILRCMGDWGQGDARHQDPVWQDARVESES